MKKLHTQAILTAAFCVFAYLLLTALIVCSCIGKLTVSCIAIGVFTNAITSLYSFRFSGKKSLVLAAGLAALVNTVFLLLRICGIYLPQTGAPVAAELVGAFLMIAVSAVWLYHSIRRYRRP